MAKIIKVGSQNPTFTSKAPNLAKTSRAGNITNPFKFTNFEGNTLQFADVFEGFEPKQTNKLKMIASSVAGSMNKIKNGIPESIVNFVNRVRGGISNAWEYAKNTNVSDLGAVKAFNNLMNTEIQMPSIKAPSIDMSGISESMSNLGRSISSRLEFLNTDVTDIGKDMAGKWSDMIARIQPKGHTVPKNAPVATYEALWRDIIALESGEAA